MLDFGCNFVTSVIKLIIYYVLSELYYYLWVRQVI
jgi:hypothetical protein